MPSKKHQRMMANGVDNHHFFWPKKFFTKNRIMTISYALHHHYHGHFMARCKEAAKRKCHLSECDYRHICCYYRRFENYGERFVT
jgi:hypothetical protein